MSRCKHCGTEHGMAWPGSITLSNTVSEQTETSKAEFEPIEVTFND